mmetsp:Transcript_24364/g.58360  ORF Transcript_24364/g.58360 Transcript_24364/m.58360 type:complete len:308 (-) Transcript_24364:153-1076(-)
MVRSTSNSRSCSCRWIRLASPCCGRCWPSARTTLPRATWRSSSRTSACRSRMCCWERDAASRFRRADSDPAASTTACARSGRRSARSRSCAAAWVSGRHSARSSLASTPYCRTSRSLGARSRPAGYSCTRRRSSWTRTATRTRARGRCSAWSRRTYPSRCRASSTGASRRTARWVSRRTRPSSPPSRARAACAWLTAPTRCTCAPRPPSSCACSRTRASSPSGTTPSTAPRSSAARPTRSRRMRSACSTPRASCESSTTPYVSEGTLRDVAFRPDLTKEAVNVRCRAARVPQQRWIVLYWLTDELAG